MSTPFLITVSLCSTAGSTSLALFLVRQIPAKSGKYWRYCRSWPLLPGLECMVSVGHPKLTKAGVNPVIAAVICAEAHLFCLWLSAVRLFWQQRGSHRYGYICKFLHLYFMPAIASTAACVDLLGSADYHCCLLLFRHTFLPYSLPSTIQLVEFEHSSKTLVHCKSAIKTDHLSPTPSFMIECILSQAS